MRKNYRIFGKVQGVGFRAATQERARALQLSGWVRNHSDGSVEALAEGAEAELAKFEAWLQQGPRWSSVEKVVVSDCPEQPSTSPLSGFSIRY